MNPDNELSAIESRFWKLCEQASSGYANHEPGWKQFLLEVVQLAQSHPVHRPHFVEWFSQLATWRRDGCYLIVPMCMNVLRYPEIQELIHAEAKAHETPELTEWFRNRAPIPDDLPNETRILISYYLKRMNYWSEVNSVYRDDYAFKLR